MALLKFKRSAVPAKVPSIADLALGELAINTYDGKVYTKKDDGTPAIVQVGGGGGVQTITSSDGSVTVTGTTDINLSVATAAATNTVLLPVRNNSGATLAKGTAVYINGALGQNPTVTKAIATGDATSAQTLGLVTANIANNAVGNVTLIGSLTNLDTSAYTDGAQLYLSPTTAGALTATKPYAPNHLVYMAVVEHAHPTLGKLFVKVQNGYEMDELHNVAAQSPANNDGLFYNTSTSLWEKKPIATALGYTPVNRAGDTMTGQLSITGAGNVNGGNLQLGDKNVNTTKWSVLTGAHYGGSSEPKGVMLIGSYSASGNNTVNIGGGVWEANPATYIAFYTTTTGTHATGGSNRLNINGSGNVTAEVDIRAPIFYDSNDTNYYVDPNSSSVLNTLYFRNSSGANVLVGNASNFGYSSSYRTLLLGNQAYTTVCIGVDPVANASGSFNGAGSGVEVMFKNGVNFITPNSANNGYLTPLTLADGYAASTGSFRAPIFYDSNNTGYYIDPASTGISAVLAGDININAGYEDNRALRFREGSTDIYGAFIKYTAGDSLELGTRNNSTTDTRAIYISRGANWAGSDGSFRAPIFYDSSDTAYYVDANNTSNFYKLSSYIAARDANANWNTGFQNTPAYSYNYHGDLNGGTNAPAAGWWFYESMRHSNASNYWGTQIAWGWEDNANRLWQRNVSGGGFGGWVEYLNTSNRTYSGNLNMTGSIISTASDVRAPIFYDQNDTGYYLDPSDTSMTNGMRANVYRSLYNGGQPAARWDTSFYVMQSQHWYSHTGAMTMYVGESGDFVYIRGYTQAEGSSRAPIFYDSNNTGYYVDPASTSYLNTVSLGAQTWRGDITWNTAVNILVPASAECSFDVATSGVWQVWDSTTGAPMIRAPAGSNVQIGEAGSRGLYVYGGITASANITAYSDIRIKDNIETIPSALDKLDQIRGVTYTRTDLADKERRYGGVIAQEIEVVLPEAVFETHDHKSVDYNATIALLIQAVKELRDEVEALRK